MLLGIDRKAHRPQFEIEDEVSMSCFSGDDLNILRGAGFIIAIAWKIAK